MGRQSRRPGTKAAAVAKRERSRGSQLASTERQGHQPRSLQAAGEHEQVVLVV